MYKKILSTYIFFSPQDKRIIVRRAHESEYIVPYYIVDALQRSYSSRVNKILLPQIIY